MKKQLKGFEHIPHSDGMIKTAGRVYTDSWAAGDDFHQLRQADYGQGFRQATFGEILDLVHASYHNQDNAGADNVVNASRGSYISGDTAMLYTLELVIVQDMPRVENGKIVMNEKGLISKLSKNPNNGVRFSDDGTIRASPYSFETEWQTEDDMKRNPLPIALTGDLDAGKKLAEIQGKIGKKGYILVLDKGINNVIRVPDLGERVSELCLSGCWCGLNDVMYSFGVRQ